LRPWSSAAVGVRRAEPILGAPEQRQADVASHLQLLAPFNHLDDTLIDLAVLRVQDVAAGPLFPVAAQAPQDLHPQDGLTAIASVAIVTGGIFLLRIDEP